MNQNTSDGTVYDVLLMAKHSDETYMIGVRAMDEDSAMDIVDRMIDENDDYKPFRTGWKIVEAIKK